MQNLFVSKDDEFVVKFVVATDKDGMIYSDINRELLLESFKEIEDNVEKYEIKSYKAVFKKPSFGDSVELHKSIFKVEDGQVNLSFNPVLVRYKKIESLIKSWDLSGEDEMPSDEQIKKLHPIIANTIGMLVDRELGGILG